MLETKNQGDRNQRPMTLVIKVVFLQPKSRILAAQKPYRSSCVKIQDSKPAKVLRGKTFKLLFTRFLKFPHNITIYLSLNAFRLEHPFAH